VISPGWLGIEFSLSESGDLEPVCEVRSGVDGSLRLRGSNRFRRLSRDGSLSWLVGKDAR